MNKIFENIINDGKAAGKTTEEINTELKAAGANFHLDKIPDSPGWTEAEKAEGFIPADKAPEEVQCVLDTRHRTDLAGQSDVQKVNGRLYDVTYDEKGYFEKGILRK